MGKEATAMGLTAFNRSRRINALKEEVCDLLGLKGEEKRTRYKERYLIGKGEDELRTLVSELKQKKTKRKKPSPSPPPEKTTEETPPGPVRRRKKAK